MTTLLLALACTGVDELDPRTAIVVEFDAESALGVASDWALYVDPEEPFTDFDGNVLGPGYDEDIDDWLYDDAEYELRIGLTETDDGLSSVEIWAGGGDPPFHLVVHGREGDSLTAASARVGPFEFVADDVRLVRIPVAPLETPVGPCDDALDNDGDGWRDADDPDCAAEVGYGDTTCNNGVDEDGDNATDAEDPDCVTPDDAYEDDPCADGEDDDTDGWIDGDDPDCQMYGNEDPATGAGFLGTACNDGEDDDGDGDADARDRECEDAYDEREAGYTCQNGGDDDGDGWDDADDPDCDVGLDEAGYGTAACNDGEDDDGDGDIDADDPSCTEA
ncbi:MAG: hypothetical protein ACOZNI_31170, partial [Myxococcota bacterium]